jgi:hypothetical protein
MRSIETSKDIAVDVETVWKTVSDFWGVAAWSPMVESVRREGDTDRRIVFAGGQGEGVERLQELDESARSLTYTYEEGPFPLQDYRSTLVVAAAGSGSRVTWSASFSAGSAELEEQLQGVVEGAYASGLDSLEALLEG